MTQESKKQNRDLPKTRYPTLKKVVLALIIVFCTVVMVDFGYFESAREKIRTVSSELGGHAYSLGGWPTGCEYNIRFDHLLTEDELQRFVAAAPKSRRIGVQLVFSCDVPKDHLAIMKKITETHHIAILVQEKENAN